MPINQLHKLQFIDLNGNGIYLFPSFLFIFPFARDVDSQLEDECNCGEIFIKATLILQVFCGFFYESVKSKLDRLLEIEFTKYRNLPKEP